MAEDLQRALDALVAACAAKAEWNNKDRALLKSVRERLGNAAQVATFLGVSPATIHNWERRYLPDELRARPPERLIKKFSGLLAQNHFRTLLDQPKPEAARPVLYDVMMRMRSLQETMERSAMCKRFWVMRSGRPFVAGTDPAAFDYVSRFVKENGTECYFVYLDFKKDPGVGPRYGRAKDSFDALMARVQDAKDCKLLTEKIRGVPIRNEVEACRLGLSDSWLSYALAEYDVEGKRRFQRDYDVWLEFVFDLSKDPQNEQKQFVWLELPADEAETWRAKRIATLEERAGIAPGRSRRD